MNQTLLIQEYIRAAIAHGDALTNGDSKTANKEYRNLTRIYKKLAKDSSVAESVLYELFQSNNYLVLVWVAAHALGLNISIDIAQKKLEEISIMTNIGIIRWVSEMTLKEWKTNGELLFK